MLPSWRPYCWPPARLGPLPGVPCGQVTVVRTLSELGELAGRETAVHDTDAECVSIVILQFC